MPVLLFGNLAAGMIVVAFNAENAIEDVQLMNQPVRLLMLALLFAPVGVQAGSGHGGGLPPGLQKKVERGESLPPGWEKKLHRGDRFPSDYYRYGVIDRVDDRYDRIRLEDRIYLVIRNTREIVDILRE